MTSLELEQEGFRYHDSRDLTGFIDGTENPKEDERFGIALVADGKPGAGGSHVFTQKWIHDLEAFHALPEKMQEKIIGRTKQDSVELEGDAMPDDSHVSRADTKVDGVAMKIYRRSAPFGNVSEHGLFFLAFACDPYRVQIQLERMTGATEDKTHDKLMEYSRPVKLAIPEVLIHLRPACCLSVWVKPVKLLRLCWKRGSGIAPLPGWVRLQQPVMLKAKSSRLVQHPRSTLRTWHCLCGSSSARLSKCHRCIRH